MAGIKGSHPSDLAPVLPGADLAQSVLPQILPQAMSSNAPPTPMAQQPEPPPDPNAVPEGIAAPPPAPEQDPLDAILDQHLGAADPLDAILDQHLGPENPEAEAAKNDEEGRSWGEAISQLPTRAKASFAPTPEAKLKYLKGVYGEDNVKSAKRGEKMLVKKDGKWKSFDPDSFDIGDVADFSRDALSEAVALPAELSAGVLAAGEVATGAGAAAAPGTLAMGRVAGGMMGEAAGQAVSAGLGFDQGGALHQGAELAMQGGLRAAFGAAADKAGAFLKGWGSRNAARIAQRSETIAEPTAAQAAGVAAGATKQAVEDMDHLVGNHIFGGVKGADGAFLTPADVNTANSTLVEAGKAAGETPEYRNFLARRGQMIATGFQRVVEQSIDATGGMFSAGKGDAAVNVAKIADRNWGETIGAMREKFRAQAGNGEIPAAKLKNAAVDTLKAMGYTFEESGEIGFVPEVKSVANKLMVSELEAERLIDKTMKLHDEIGSGRAGFLKADALEGQYNELKRQANALFNSSTASYEMRGAFGKLRDAARDDFADGFGTLLSGEAKQEYQKAMANYSTVKGAAETLTGLFDKDQMTAKSVSQYLFGEGANSLDRIKSMKTILAVEDPKAWDDIGMDWVKQLQLKHGVADDSGQVIGKMNWRALQKELAGKPEVVNEVFGEAGSDTLNRFLRIAGQVQDSMSAQGMMKPKEKAAMGSLLTAGAMLFKGHPGPAGRLILGIGNSKARDQMLTAEGRKELLKYVASGNRGSVTTMLDGLVKMTTKASELPGADAAGVAAREGLYQAGRGVADRSTNIIAPRREQKSAAQ